MIEVWVWHALDWRLASKGDDIGELSNDVQTDVSLIAATDEKRIGGLGCMTVEDGINNYWIVKASPTYRQSATIEKLQQALQQYKTASALKRNR